MDGWLDEISFFPGEDAEALKTRFVELCAYHQLRFSFFEVAQYVFKNLREPALRAGQAAEVWGKDLDVIERVRVLMLKGPDTPEPDDSEVALRRRTLAIVDDPRAENKDKIAALTLLAKIGGHVKKEIELGFKGGSGEGGNADLISQMAKLLPV